MKNSYEKLIEYTQYFCGYLEKEHMDEEYVEEIRDKRLTVLVINDVKFKYIVK